MLLLEHGQEVAKALFEISAPRPDDRPSVWVGGNIVFDEPDCRERWSFHGRRYLEFPIDWWADEESTDLTFVAGTRTGKTRSIFAGLGWLIVHAPARCLYVMPNTEGTGGAKNVSRTRLQPMIEATANLASLMPEDDLSKTLQLLIGGAIVDLTGANSPANLAGNPCRAVIQDEVDKFPTSIRNEAGAVDLADERSAEYSLPKRIKTSSPTITEGQIWQSLLGSNIHRRFIPCVGCGKLVVLSWTKRMQVLPIDGREAFVKWDKEAKRPSGWDLDWVERSARYVCPHCGHDINQLNIIRADKNGVWECVQKGAPRHIGLHLPSLYSSSVQMSPGRLAVQFLKAKASFGGLQNFVNSKLAEPWESQDVKAEFVGNIITKRHERPDDEKVESILTVDVQQTIPHFYYVIREWTHTGDSRRLAFGHLDKYAEIAELQMDHGIKNVRVGLDCGDQESKESQYESDVYAECMKRGVVLNRKHLGWIPMRGMKASWKHRDKKGRETIVGLTKNPVRLGRTLLYPLLFNGDNCLDIWDALVKGKEAANGRRWELVQQDDERDYEKHMSGKVKGRRDASGRTWHPRSHRAPAHWLDCEKEQVAIATYVGWLEWGAMEESK